MTSTRPVALEIKAAAALLEPLAAPTTPSRGSAHERDELGTITALVAVTGVRDDVDDVIVPGAFHRTIRERTPRLVVAHDWGRVCGQVLSAVELLPGDPRLPATAPDGTPWPREAGALWVRGRFLLGTREGREQHEIARAFGTSQGWSIGYKAVKVKHRGGVRYIYDLDVFEASPVLHGANRYAGLLDVKANPALLEARQQREGLPKLTMCSVCGNGAASILPGGLRPGETLICASCIAAARAAAAPQDGAVLTPAELAAAEQVGEPELTAEDEYADAITADQEWHLQADGSLSRAPRSAWRNRSAR